MLNALFIIKYIIKVHTKNTMRKTQKMDEQKLADNAMRINQTRLINVLSCQCIDWPIILFYFEIKIAKEINA